MNDVEREIRDTLLRHQGDAPPLELSAAHRVATRARRRQVRTVVVGGIAGAAAVIGVVAGLGGLVRADRSPSVLDRPSPSQTSPQPDWSPVREGGALTVHRGRREDHGIAWRDPHDAPVGWVDVRRVFTQESSDGYWTIELAAKPPRAAGLEEGLLIAYGLVLDTTDDGVADYLIGIDNDAPQRRPGAFHVWVTDLRTGEIDEQIGGPYGYPIEFSHPDEWESGDNYNPRTLVLTFLGGSGPADLNPETVRFYAWASATRDGEVFAWDYAPDAGWMTRT